MGFHRYHPTATKCAANLGPGSFKATQNVTSNGEDRAVGAGARRGMREGSKWLLMRPTDAQLFPPLLKRGLRRNESGYRCKRNSAVTIPWSLPAAVAPW